jgi:hypothetical protein
LLDDGVINNGVNGVINNDVNGVINNGVIGVINNTVKLETDACPSCGTPGMAFVGCKCLLIRPTYAGEPKGLSDQDPEMLM